MELAPSAAARLLAGTIRPGGDLARWEAADPGTREAALRLATAARVDALLAATLSHAAASTASTSSSALAVPADLAARASREVALAKLAWVEGGRVLDALEAAGCVPIALKGGDLSGRAWPAAYPTLADRAALRSAADLDVLVAPDALAPAADALARAGYRADRDEAAHHRRFRIDNPAHPVLVFSVEVHVDLFDRPHGLRLDLDAQRARAVLCEMPGGTRRVLAPEDALVHIAGHAVFSDLLADPISTLRAPLDLLAFAAAAPADPDTTAARAVAAGLAAPVALALHWVRALVGDATLPPSLAALEAALPKAAGWRASLARRRTLRLAARATSGRTAPRLPFTATRALLAPTASTALAMLLEGARRRA